MAFKVASQYGVDSDKLNDPLLCEPHEHWHDYVECDVDTCKNYCEKHLHLINRMHDRTMTCLRKILEGNQCYELPKVDVNFGRDEYQSADSKGNRYHLHAGMNTKDMTLSDLRKIICADPNFIFHDECETSYPCLLQKGVVSCYEECVYVQNILFPCARHWCVVVNDRCHQRVGEDGVLMCRVKDRPPSNVDYFLITHNIYSEEATKLLIELNLGHYEDYTVKEMRKCNYSDKEKLVTHDSLTAGTHFYKVATSEDCKHIPMMPIMGIIMRSSTNAQVCSNRFMHSYLIKYTVGQEVRKIAQINFNGTPGEIEIQTGQGGDPNLKITGARIWDNSEKNKNKIKNQNTMEVSRTELSANLLEFEYSHCNACFTHVNTMPPEYRPRPLKRKNTDASNPDNEEENPFVDPNDDRRHINEQWRKFTIHQLDHAKEYFASKLQLNGGVEMFNIRPPEFL